MKSVTFITKRGLSARSQENFIESLKTLNGVRDAAPLYPNARNDAVSRMFYLMVDDDLDIAPLFELLATRNEIESVDIPAERYAAWGSSRSA